MLKRPEASEPTMRPTKRTPTALSAAAETEALPEALRVPGIHHVTAISGPAQQNMDFYSDVLGLRTVKQT